MTAEEKRAFWIGAGVTLWVGRILINAAGVMWGSHVPGALPNGLLLAIVMVSLAGPSLTDWPTVVGAVAAAAVMWFGASMPAGMDVLLAGGAGVSVVFIVEELKS